MWIQLKKRTETPRPSGLTLGRVLVKTVTRREGTGIFVAIDAPVAALLRLTRGVPVLVRAEEKLGILTGRLKISPTTEEKKTCIASHRPGTTQFFLNFTIPAEYEVPRLTKTEWTAGKKSLTVCLPSFGKTKTEKPKNSMTSAIAARPSVRVKLLANLVKARAKKALYEKLRQSGVYETYTQAVAERKIPTTSDRDFPKPPTIPAGR